MPARGTNYFRFRRELPRASDAAVPLQWGAMAKQMSAFEVACPDCGAILTVDPETRSIIGHKSAPRKRTFEDFEGAARALRDQEERKESIFRQSMESERNKKDIMERRFAEAVKRAKDDPSTGKSLRDFDLD
jgi:hypothetical protein